MKVNGCQIEGMVVVRWYTTVVKYMKVNGLMVSDVVLVCCVCQMVTYMKDTGLTTRRKGQVGAVHIVPCMCAVTCAIAVAGAFISYACSVSLLLISNSSIVDAQRMLSVYHYKLVSCYTHNAQYCACCITTTLYAAGRYLFMQTRKLYEGEWVNDTPKCGEYKDMPQELVNTAVPDEGFALPQLALDRPGTILDDAVARIRNDRAARFHQPGRVFTSDELDQLRSAFDHFSSSDSTGMLATDKLHSLLQSVGVGVSESDVQGLLLELQTGQDAVMMLTFSEFTDILSLLQAS
jgi:hypothetical protein